MKKKIVASSVSKPKKPTVRMQLDTLKSAVRTFFYGLQYRQVNMEMSFPVKPAPGTDPMKPNNISVPQIATAVITAQGLGQEARLVVTPSTSGDILKIQFVSPIKRPAELVV